MGISLVGLGPLPSPAIIPQGGLGWKVQGRRWDLSCTHSIGPGGVLLCYDCFITVEHILLGDGIYIRIVSAPPETRDLIINLRSKEGLNKVPWEGSACLVSGKQKAFS